MESNCMDEEICIPLKPSIDEKTRKSFPHNRLFLLIVSFLILSIAVGVLAILFGLQISHGIFSEHHDLPCPEDWIMYKRKCYYFSESEANWISSHDFCSSHHALLAKIEKEEEDFIMRLKGKDSYWIGLRRDSNQPWKWTSGENATLEVLGNGGDCAYLNNEAKVTASSSRCSSVYRWICRKSATAN